MNKSHFLVITLFLMLLIMFLPAVTATIGFGPAEMYVSNQRDALIIGNATLINGDEVAKYGVFSLIMPYNNKDTYQIVESELLHARAICNVCGESMQLGEVLPSYKYGDPLDGTCTKCDSGDLTFYMPMSRDEYEMFSLETAGNFHLEKLDHHTWKTKELISPMGACNIHVLYDASSSYIMDNFGKNWEIHLRGKTVEEAGEGFMAGGIDLRVLIDFKFPLHIELLDTPVKGDMFRVQIKYGPPDKRWLRIPEKPVDIDFNGIKGTTDENSIATFTFPDTRQDYTYKLTAVGTDTYLSSTELISNEMDVGNNNGILGFLNNIYVLILILALVIICIAVVILKHYYVWD